MTFTQPPTVGPKVYVVTSSSGWPQTFRRSDADRALAAYLDPLVVDEQVATFVLGVDAERWAEAWGGITDFLTALTGRVPPAEVGVAFWAAYLRHQEAA